MEDKLFFVYERKAVKVNDDSNFRNLAFYHDSAAIYNDRW
jgi:hypothetical protein